MKIRKIMYFIFISIILTLNSTYIFAVRGLTSQEVHNMEISDISGSIKVFVFMLVFAYILFAIWYMNTSKKDKEEKVRKIKIYLIVLIIISIILWLCSEYVNTLKII